MEIYGKENRPCEKQERSLRDILNDLRDEMRKKHDAETEVYLLTLELFNVISGREQ